MCTVCNAIWFYFCIHSIVLLSIESDWYVRDQMATYTYVCLNVIHFSYVLKNNINYIMMLINCLYQWHYALWFLIFRISCYFKWLISTNFATSTYGMCKFCFENNKIVNVTIIHLFRKVHWTKLSIECLLMIVSENQKYMCLRNFGLDLFYSL